MVENHYTIEATLTSLDILELLVGSDEPLGVTAIADEVGVTKSAVHNHLSTLRTREYVVSQDGKYEPSLRVLSLGHRTRDGMNVHGGAREKLKNLAEATGETTMLCVMEEDKEVPVSIVETRDGWSPPFREGDRLPLHVNAPGKALLASLPDERVHDIRSAEQRSTAGDETTTGASSFSKEISRIRDDGISFSREEQYEGIVGVAAPIPETSGTRHAALGVAGPGERLSGRHLEEDITGLVVRTSKAVHVELAGK